MFVNEKLVILYGSQTGNAQDLAERIWRETKRFHFRSSVKSMDEYNILDLVNEYCVIFVCSTTGQGEEPDNMRLFWKFLLKKHLPIDSLAKLKYAVLGLGDSSYTKFNFAAKKLHKRLAQLGGHPLIPLGLADDQHDLGYDAISDSFITSLFTKILSLHPLPPQIAPLTTIQPKFGVILPKLTKNIDPKRSIYHSSRQPNEFQAKVLENTRTTHSNHFQDVRLIKLDTKGQHYEPGDVVVLRPQNLPWQIEEFKRVLKENGVQFGGHIQAVARYTEITFPAALKETVLVERLYEEYFDLNAVPRRRTFEILAEITDSELEKEKCLEFTSSEGQNDLYAYCNRPKRNIVEVLGDFPHATKNLNYDLLFEIMTPMKPREFSIASSWKMHENEVHILVAVVKYKTKLKKERFGLCSNFLADLRPGDEVSAWIKKGSFKFPSDPSLPVIMVGPGTGVAPFRNFIFERVKENAAFASNLVLFFGCRGRELDFHCKNEFVSLKDDDKLTLIPAYSREEDHKVYVQHKIVEHQQLVWDFLQRKGHIFVAGSAKFMPKEVRDAFVQVCEKAGLTKDEAESFIVNMEKKNFYQTECWS